MGTLIEKVKKFFTLRTNIDEIKIKRDTINKIIDLSRETHPKEFLAFFDGIIGPEVIITDIFYQPYIANNRSAFARLDIPLTTRTLGSIHSHPGPRNTPSSADRTFFRKSGLVHAIIGYPYREEDVAFYNHHGEQINVTIIN